MTEDLSPLSALGLSPAQQRVYQALTLDDGCDGSVDAVAVSAALPRGDTAAVLEELAALGLVIRDAGAQLYTCSPVEAALDGLAAARREELARAEAFSRTLAARATQMLERRGPDQLVSVVRGREQIRAVDLQLQRSAREQMRTFDRPPHLTMWHGDSAIDPAQVSYLAAGLRARTIYDLSMFDDPARLAMIRGEIAAGESGRVMADLPLKLRIADENLALLPLIHAGEDDEPAALLVRRSVLLDSLVSLFEALWRAAKPVVLSGEGLAQAEEDPEVRQLVELLNTGLTEDRLARLLGVSERTVRRRLTAAREALGATTMFQAGVEAARRGWI